MTIGLDNLDSMIFPEPRDQKDVELFSFLRNFLNRLSDAVKVLSQKSNNSTGSIVVSSDTFALSGDSASPGNEYYYGTNTAGNKGFYALPSANSFYAYNTVNQSVNDSVSTVVNFPTEAWDTGGEYNTGTYRFTPAAGKYLLGASIAAKVDTDDIVSMTIYKNANEYAQVTDKASSDLQLLTVDLTCLAEASGSDYFEVKGYHNYGAATGILGADYKSVYFYGLKI